MRSMPLHEVEAALAEVVDEAAAGAPTVITWCGQPLAVVVGFDEWQRLSSALPWLADLLLAVPKDAEVPRHGGVAGRHRGGEPEADDAA